VSGEMFRNATIYRIHNRHARRLAIKAWNMGAGQFGQISGVLVGEFCFRLY
jgi:hypothetical protein